MTDILLVTPRRDALADFAATLEGGDAVSLRPVGTAAAALDAAAASTPALVVVDETVTDMPALQLVRELLGVSAMINTAVVSSLSRADFHEAAEGLGVIAQLPAQPDSEAATALLQKLKSLTSF